MKGTVKELIPWKKLVQTWEPSDWEPQNKASVATFTLAEKDGGTEVRFEQTNVLDKQYKSTDDGWRDFYLEAIKDYLERRSWLVSLKMRHLARLGSVK